MAVKRIERIWSKVKEQLLGILEIPYVSEELAEMKRPLLLHVSDTPGMTYSFIGRLVRRLGPEFIVHTGDMADEVKLELAPAQVGEYRSRLQRLLRILRSGAPLEVYLVPGNHDKRSVIEELSAGERIVQEGTTISLGEYRIRLDHDFHETGDEEEADFHLFGHNVEIGSAYSAQPVRLNGITHIHVLSLADGCIHTLPYPAGTDSARKMLPPRVGM
jgi:predicted phosphodiesterase